MESDKYVIPFPSYIYEDSLQRKLAELRARAWTPAEDERLRAAVFNAVLQQPRQSRKGISWQQVKQKGQLERSELEIRRRHDLLRGAVSVQRGKSRWTEDEELRVLLATDELRRDESLRVAPAPSEDDKKSLPRGMGVEELKFWRIVKQRAKLGEHRSFAACKLFVLRVLEPRPPKSSADSAERRRPKRRRVDEARPARQLWFPPRRRARGSSLGLLSTTRWREERDEQEGESGSPLRTLKFCDAVTKPSALRSPPEKGHRATAPFVLEECFEGGVYASLEVQGVCYRGILIREDVLSQSEVENSAADDSTSPHTFMDMVSQMGVPGWNPATAQAVKVPVVKRKRNSDESKQAKASPKESKTVAKAETLSNGTCGSDDVEAKNSVPKAELSNGACGSGDSTKSVDGNHLPCPKGAKTEPRIGQEYQAITLAANSRPASSRQLGGEAGIPVHHVLETTARWRNLPNADWRARHGTDGLTALQELQRHLVPLDWQIQVPSATDVERWLAQCMQADQALAMNGGAMNPSGDDALHKQSGVAGSQPVQASVNKPTDSTGPTGSGDSTKPSDCNGKMQCSTGNDQTYLTMEENRVSQIT